MDRWYKKEQLKEQKNLVKWTRNMAIGALIAAGLTAIYVIFTWNILEQARIDSDKEFRPYVVLEDFTIDILQTGTTEADSLVLPFKIRYGFMNSGRTPAIDFKLVHRYSNCKDTTKASIDELINHSKESKTSSTLHGSIPRYSDKRIEFIFKTQNGKIVGSYIQTERGMLDIYIGEDRYAYFYFNCAFTYTDMYEKTEYEGYHSMCILLYLVSGEIEVANDFSYIN